MPAERYRDPKVIRKTEADFKRLADDLDRLFREKREAAIQAATRGRFIDEPIIDRDTSLDHLLPPAPRKKANVLT